MHWVNNVRGYQPLTMPAPTTSRHTPKHDVELIGLLYVALSIRNIRSRCEARAEVIGMFLVSDINHTSCPTTSSFTLLSVRLDLILRRKATAQLSEGEGLLNIMVTQ